MATVAHSQPMQALERANHIRLARADIRRQLKTNQLTAVEVINHMPEAVLSWEVGEMLASQCRWGPKRVRALLSRLAAHDCHVSWHREMRMLTDRQRCELAKELSR